MLPRGLVENANLNVDRLDDKVVAHGRVGIGRQEKTAGAEEINAIVTLVDYYRQRRGCADRATNGADERSLDARWVALERHGSRGPTRRDLLRIRRHLCRLGKCCGPSGPER